jgi:hypothetical protein
MDRKKYIARLVNSVGKKNFILNYEDFKSLAARDGDISELFGKLNGSFQPHSERSIISTGKRIFREGLQVEALQQVIESKHRDIIPLRAKAKYLRDLELVTGS